ncbi:hypothetical protein MRQ36_31415 [Micromonospora sp. R77]|uniref:hypothetical protein n=1 Tax=Micromonospora sp. R77 TaxID=2925836 RepID=UPI001F619A49|nr:hypothetical protein [Micromonospora sp. R77]MCI4066828.1 hypothetical protein [Micromonospora sp. R77]
MNVTDLRLLVAAGVLAVGAVAGGVWVWRRRPRPGVAVRAGVVVLAELLLVTAGALVVNRVEGFYPTWAALAQHDPATQRWKTTPGRLDATIRRLARGSDQAVLVPWPARSLAAWPGAGAAVVTPVDYLRRPAWRYPAVLVLSSADGWSDAQVLAAARQTAPAAVVVAVRVPQGMDPATLALGLPLDLERDLRVTGHRWGLVASAGMRHVARDVVARDVGRFPVLAVAAGTSEPVVVPPGAPPPAAPFPAGVLAVQVGLPARGAAAGPDRSQTGLVAALRWVQGQLPAPLAAPAPVLTPSAVPRPGRHHSAGHTHPTRRPRPVVGVRHGS